MYKRKKKKGLKQFWDLIEIAYPELCQEVRNLDKLHSVIVRLAEKSFFEELSSLIQKLPSELYNFDRREAYRLAKNLPFPSDHFIFLSIPEKIDSIQQVFDSILIKKIESSPLLLRMFEETLQMRDIGVRKREALKGLAKSLILSV